ncbi:MAG: thioredoxin TrxC [Gammaproteobacteria bacterium]|nr:thioredoxin TrxC [Gammaproteobacteria bacterium]
MSDAKHVVCPHCSGINRVPADRLGAGGKCGRCKQPLFSASPAEVGDAAFRAHLARNDIPVLVDFWAPWCGPCRMMAPAFAEAARQLEPNVRLLKVNTEEQQAIAAQFGIRSIPTMALFARGGEVQRVSGAMDARSIVAWVRQHLG